MLNLKQIEKMTEDFIDLQIKELNEEEKRENEKIKEDLKIKNFILNNLDNKEYSFSFDFYSDEDLNKYYGLFINIKYIKNNVIKYYTLTEYHIYSDYYQKIILTNEEIEKLIEYEAKKMIEEQKNEEEREF